MPDENRNINDNVPKSDRVSRSRTIFDASAGEILWRNFLAGMGRALGGIFLYLVFVFLFSAIFTRLVLPKITPLIDTVMKLGNTAGNIQNLNLPTIQFPQ